MCRSKCAGVSVGVQVQVCRCECRCAGAGVSAGVQTKKHRRKNLLDSLFLLSLWVQEIINFARFPSPGFEICLAKS